jgi:hypothetical protein
VSDEDDVQESEHAHKGECWHIHADISETLDHQRWVQTARQTHTYTMERPAKFLDILAAAGYETRNIAHHTCMHGMR